MHSMDFHMFSMEGKSLQSNLNYILRKHSINHASTETKIKEATNEMDEEVNVYNMRIPFGIEFGYNLDINENVNPSVELIVKSKY